MVVTHHCELALFVSAPAARLTAGESSSKSHCSSDARQRGSVGLSDVPKSPTVCSAVLLLRPMSLAVTAAQEPSARPWLCGGCC